MVDGIDLLKYGNNNNIDFENGNYNIESIRNILSKELEKAIMSEINNITNPVDFFNSRANKTKIRNLGRFYDTTNINKIIDSINLSSSDPISNVSGIGAVLGKSIGDVIKNKSTSNE